MTTSDSDSRRLESNLCIPACYPAMKSMRGNKVKQVVVKDSRAGASEGQLPLLYEKPPPYPPLRAALSSFEQNPGSATEEDVKWPWTTVSSITEEDVQNSSTVGLSEEITTTKITSYVVLYQAALKGDWETASVFLDQNPRAECSRISKGRDTALHIAAGTRHTVFVEELVKRVEPEDLELQNSAGNTALCFAAASGITRIAEVMVEKNENLPTIRGSKGATPLHMAALLGDKNMVWYLYLNTKDEALTMEDRIELLIATITTNLYDVALDLVKRHPKLATARAKNEETALHVLARKPLTFANESIKVANNKNVTHIQALELVKFLWDQVLFLLDDSKIADLIREPSRLLFTAAELGNVEFITVLIRSYPDLIWKVNSNGQSIYHMAVAYRQENVFNLIYEIGALKDLIAAYVDEESNTNMLHLAGKVAPPIRLNTVPGAALQMQRELLWFKEVEKIVPPLYTEMKNKDGKTPRDLFTESHKRLVRDGEKWMKETSTSCMVVGTLISTVMFAALFTVPRGINNDKGTPIFLQTKAFMIFVISDALSLFSSVTSVLMFLSILTSRYAEEDFLKSLPRKLTIGLATLFFSIATMMITFSATFFIVLGHPLASVAIPIASLASVPATLFVWLQFPLFIDVACSTFKSSIFYRSSKDMLY